MSELFDYDEVDRLVVGALGEPGQRVFLLQIRAGSHLLTLKLEKQQVAALAVYLSEVLSDLPVPTDLPDDMALEEPTEPTWVAGPIGVSYDDGADRLLLVVEEATPEGEAGASARVSATRGQIAALARLGRDLVAAGRPPCSLCGYPLDPAGHLCPRTNGQHPPKL